MSHYLILTITIIMNKLSIIFHNTTYNNDLQYDTIQSKTQDEGEIKTAMLITDRNLSYFVVSW